MNRPEKLTIAVDTRKRLDRVTIKTARGDIVVPRQALIDEFKGFEFFAPIRAAFDSAGVSRPVQLTPQQKSDLLKLIHFWCRRTPGGFDGLPEGVHELWIALTSDVDHTHDQRA